MKKQLLSLLVLMVFLNTSVTFGTNFTVTNPAEFQSVLSEAATNGEDDTITVTPGTYSITSPLTYETTNGDGGHSLIIQGAGTDSTILDGANIVQIMKIDTDKDNDGGDEGAQVTIKDLSFKNGNGSTQSGGGIWVKTASASITVENCSFSENHSSNGGGICAYSDAGKIKINNSVFSGNSASKGGGGLYVSSDSGEIDIDNNTFSGNLSGKRGGGVLVCLYDDKTVLKVDNNTFEGNTASEGGYDGDELYVFSDKNGNSVGSTVNLYGSEFPCNVNFETGQSEDLYITATDNYYHGGNTRVCNDNNKTSLPWLLLLIGD